MLLCFKVTKHEDAAESEWKKWNWRSEGDLMLNGAFFTRSGAGASSSYAKASSLSARPSSLVSSLTGNAGSLTCRKGRTCWLNLLSYPIPKTLILLFNHFHLMFVNTSIIHFNISTTTLFYSMYVVLSLPLFFLIHKISTPIHI